MKTTPKRHGRPAETALDEVLAVALEWERQDYQEALEGIRQGYADVRADRTNPIDESFTQLRKKHGL